ncbi:MAG: redoxin family protein [Alphaproteobacteria bacterium]|nr:redoxin family protein [Alphaproteobacteria bacterium]
MRRVSLVLCALAACTGDKVSVDDSVDVTDDTSVTTDDTSVATDDTAQQEATRATVDGTITWNVDFDATAEAAGGTDCAYTRHYTGVEDRSLPWLCPGCELVFQADVAVSEGLDDCYYQVTSTAPTDTEWLAYADGAWYRASVGALTERGPASLDGDTWTLSQWVPEYPPPMGGNLTFDIQGTLTVGEEVGDPDGGWGASGSYACGWPKADPAPYEGDYVLQMEQTIPDGVFQDVCEDRVRLHDFQGRYLVIEVSAMDCPPCQSAARAEHDFVSGLAAEGIDVNVITMLAPSLSDTAGTPSTSQLNQWITTFELDEPVLADRMWGLAIAGVYHGEDFGYPTFVVVDTELKAFYTQVGFSNYSAMADAIREREGG